MVRKTQYRTELGRQADKRRIYAALFDSSKRFTDLLNELKPLSRSYLSLLLTGLKKDGIIDKDIKDGVPVWFLTKKGKEVYRNSWTILEEAISNILRKGGSYIHSSNSHTTWGYNVTNLTDKKDSLDTLYVGMDLVEFPRNLEKTLNFVNVQYNVKDYLIKEILKEMQNKRFDNFPSDSKIILAFSLDLVVYFDFVKKTIRFVDDIKNNIDVFLDSELKIQGSNRELELFERYIDNAKLWEEVNKDQVYLNKLKQLIKSKEFTKKLIELTNSTDLDTLKKFVTLFKTGQDPLDDRVLSQRLIIKVKLDNSQSAFIEAIYDYIKIARITNYFDKTLYRKLKEYDFVNRWDLSKSKVNRIEMGLSFKHKNNYKKEKSGIYRCKDCGTGFQTLEQYETHNCIPQNKA